MGIPYLKGHGTENDFVLLPDVDAVLELTDARVRALCDRRRGLGADGVLRVVRAKSVEDAPSDVDDVDSVDPDAWFMDYRNADGSTAEMCGNGARVFARYLVESGLERSSQFVFGSRGGARPAIVHDDRTVTIDMGRSTVFGRSAASVSGRLFEGVAVDVGNPHLVCVLDGGLAELDLTRQPEFDPGVFPEGVNIEFVVPAGPGHIRMRVHERGVGETRACGTGTVAAVTAVLHLAGSPAGQSTVDVPGGAVRVTVDEHTTTLTGPAVFVARGEIDPDWWANIS